jgi:host factor-I protein
VEDTLLNKRPANLQDGFLNQLRRQRIPITLFLSSGVQLRGHLAGFDSFVMILESPGKPTQLVYKHSIVSVAPAWAPAPPPPRPPAPEQAAADGEETVNPGALEIGHEAVGHDADGGETESGPAAADAVPPA